MSPVDGWEMVIGLEVHCELATKTKLFCSCPNQFGSEPNTNVCPVCLGLPGSLPVISEAAVELAMRIGTALHCTIQPSVFHRKNYFYPDMPKDYQVSQYDRPINIDGHLELPDGTRIGIERAHMEEDTGKSTHVGGSGRIQGADYSLVDYNRSGVPLVEIVSRPEMTSADQAKAYAAELRGILVATGASDGKMEEGSMRVDANVSVRRPGEALGTRCEVKNLNSLRSLQRAIDYEASRQVDVLTGGGRIVQETRHWSEADGRTSSMRSKEEANDYRYFQEPDLVPLDPSADWIADVAASLPPMPSERRRALSAATDATLAANSDAVMTVVDLGLDRLVLAAVYSKTHERVLNASGAQRALNHAANDLAGVDPQLVARIDGPWLAALVRSEEEGSLTATQAKVVIADAFERLRSRGGQLSSAKEIAAERGFEAMDAGSLASLVDQLVAASPAEFERLKAGDVKVSAFFVGQAMNQTGGKADGKALTALLRAKAGL